MRRLARLHAIVEHLRSRRAPVTVADLAQRFGVTARTMFRDLADLRDNEVPIESSAGPGGGVRLGRAYTLPPLGLAIDEVVSLWIAAQLAQELGQAPLLAALDKVLGGLSPETRAPFDQVVRRIVVGPPAPVSMGGARPDPAVYRTCERALLDAATLALTYVDAEGELTERVVEPHGLLVLDPVWYLLAVDHLRAAPRTFRLDRVRTAVAGPPGAFDPVDPRTLFPRA
ncbi:MAG: WYL domain-containing protein [Myxococcota bacterium]